jgi:tetratricopeptide (TPR) repeat protein
MISEFKNNERIFSSLADRFGMTNEGIFGDPSAELQEALRSVLRDSTEQTEVEKVLERIVRDLFWQASRDNSAIERQDPKGVLKYSKLQLLKEFIKDNEKTIGICLSLKGPVKEGEICILKAMILIAVEEYEIAAHYYDQAATLLKDSIVARFGLSLCLRRMGRYPEALEAIDQVLSVETDNLFALREKARVLESLNRNDDALSILARAQVLSPDDAEILRQIGVLLLKLERRKEALEILEKAVWCHPLSPDCWMFKGLALSLNQDHQGGLECYQRAVALDRSNWAATYLVGLSLAGIGSHQEALEDFHAALTLAPDTPNIYWSIGVSLRNLGRNDEALAACEQALQIQPNFLFAWEEKAHILAIKKDWQKTLETCLRAGEKCGKSARIWDIKGFVFGQLGQWQAAADCYDEVLKFTPEDAVMWFNKGSNLLKISVGLQGNPKQGRIVTEALDCAKRSVQINPEYGHGYYICGLAYIMKGDVNQGVPLLLKASTLGVIEAGILVGSLKK